MAESLAGRCGIPLEKDRVYINIELEYLPMSIDGGGSYAPRRMVFPSGRTRQIDSVLSRRTYGRKHLGNFVACWVLSCRGRQVTVWRERGRYFIRAA